MRRASILLSLVFIYSFHCQAQTTRYVPGQYASIQVAINASNSGDTVRLTSKITERGIVINKSIVLLGIHPDSSVIDGSSGNYSYPYKRILTIQIGTVTIENIGFRNGEAENSFGLPFPRSGYSYGGAIENNANLKIYNSKFSYNKGPGYGGAICNYGILFIENTIFDSNSTGSYGGAIYTTNEIEIMNSYFHHNVSYKGGGLYNKYNGNVISSDFNSNSASYGASIFNEGDLEIKFSEFENEFASQEGGAIYNNSELNFSYSKVSNSQAYNGCAIYNNKNAIIINSTIEKNHSSYLGKGGGIYNSGNCNIVNSTIINNYLIKDYDPSSNTWQYGYGGGIYNSDSLILYNCTIAGNSTGNFTYGPGIYNTGQIKTKNTILANNENCDIFNSFFGNVISYGFNLIKSYGNVLFNSTGDTFWVDPLLDSLKYNGGFTPTCALQAGSPAIGNGSYYDMDGNPVLSDQRGYYRTIPTDIGAYESDPLLTTSYHAEFFHCVNDLVYSALEIELLDTNNHSNRQFVLFKFSLDSTTNASDISKAYVLFNNKIFGDTILNPTDSFTISDSIFLNKGVNQFSLKYILNANIQSRNYLDAACLKIDIDSQNIALAVSHPAHRTFVEILPQIIQQPSLAIACKNDSISIFVSTNPTGLQSFQWFKKDTLISGEMDTLLSFPALNFSDTASYFCAISNSCGTIFSDTVSVKISQPPKPIISNLGKSILCFGESTILQVQNSFSYLWNTLDTGQQIHVDTTGLFAVQLIDSLGCYSEPSDSVSIIKLSKPQQPIIDTTRTTHFCEGNSVVLQSRSVHSAYLWSTGDTNRNTKIDSSIWISLQIGNEYDCKSDWSDSIQIVVYTNPLKPNIQILIDSAFCVGDSTILSTAVYQTYLWNTGDSNQQLAVNTQGYYSISISDSNNCQSPVSDSVFIETYQLPPKAEISVLGNLEFCEGDSTILLLQEGYTYLWNNNDTNRYLIIKQSGSFKAQLVSKEGCFGELSDSVSPVMNPIPDTPSIVESGQNKLTSNLTADAYFWFLNSTLLGAKSKTIVPAHKGLYQILIEEHNCYSDTSLSFFYIPSDISPETNRDNELNIFPNPASTYLKISLVKKNEGDIVISIFDFHGRLVYQSKEYHNSIEINVSSLSKGIYLLKVHQSGKLYFETFMKE